MSREALLARLDVSRETSARLDALVAVLEKWSRTLNLVGKGTLAEVWTRHVEDSAQLWPLAPASARSWIDLGSGAGFPGLVIAALAADERPDLHVTLVESDTRKAAFLGAAAREMGVSVTIRDVRIEALEAPPADVVSARALASLDRLLDYAAPLLAPGGVCLFPKGAGHASELTEARRRWQCRVVAHPSRTDPAAVVLEIQELARAAAPDR